MASGQSVEGREDLGPKLDALLTDDAPRITVSGNEPPEPARAAADFGVIEASDWGVAPGPYGDATLNAASAGPRYAPLGRLGHQHWWGKARLKEYLAPPTGRHRGMGQPLQYESWRYRPFSAGWFVGMLQGSSLIDDWVAGKQGFFGGYRFGWDYDHYWGCELRVAFGNVALCDSQRAKAAQQAADDALGLAPDDPFRERFDRRRDATTCVWDVSLLHYPWGESAWRPYLMVGLGAARIEFIDRLSTRYEETLFGIPLAMGLKYRANDRIAWRLELADNIAFGGGLNTVHHFSLTGGAEIRFGGRRVAYWPWNPGRHYW